MRYFEILLEASEEVWSLIFSTYDDLAHRMSTDPDTVLVECVLGKATAIYEG